MIYRNLGKIKACYIHFLCLRALLFDTVNLDKDAMNYVPLTTNYFIRYNGIFSIRLELYL